MDANEDILSGKDRKARNRLFTSIRDGDFDLDDYKELMSPASKCLFRLSRRDWQVLLRN